MRKYLCLIIAFCGITISGCTTRLTDFTIISTKNIEFSKIPSYKRTPERSTGEDSAFIACIIPVPIGKPTLKDAIDRAIEKVPGAVALVDGVVYQKFFWFIFGKNSYIVEGTPLVDPSLIANLPDKSKGDYLISYYNQQKKKQITMPVSEFDPDNDFSLQ